MKNVLLLALITCGFASAAALQAQNRTSSDVFSLGTRSVKIPAPEGFSEILTKFDRIVGRLIATEDPNNEVLTSHLPTDSLSKFEKEQNQDLGFYTKVSVSRSAKTLDASPEIFAQIVSNGEKNLENMADPNGALMKQVEKNSSKGLSEFWGNASSVKMNENKVLGFFEKSRNVFSLMMFANIDVNGYKYSILNASSIVLVNRRLIYIYSYKMHPTAGDIEMLTAFQKKWTAAIVAANK